MNKSALYHLMFQKKKDSMWLNGPKFLQSSEEYIAYNTVFPLLDPENDK